MSDMAKIMNNVTLVTALMGTVLTFYGFIDIDKRNRFFRMGTIVMGVIIFTGSIYARVYLYPIHHRAKVTDISVIYEDILSVNSIKVRSITLHFGKEYYMIPSSLSDVGDFFIRESSSFDNFKNYGITLDDELNYPLIKKEDIDEFETYLKDKFLEETYKDIR